MSMTIMLSACNKEEIVPLKKELSVTEEIVEGPTAKYGAYGSAWKELQLGQYPYDNSYFAVCVTPGLTCYRPTLWLLGIEIINDAVNVVNTEVEGDIQAFFLANQDTLNNTIPDSLLQGVIDGDMTVVNYGDFEVGSSAHLIFYDLNDELVLAIELEQ